jgi:hypothetical protein
MNAWHAKVLTEMKMDAKAKKAAPATSAPAKDLEKLHFMALTIQSKLATLANIAIDILIKEINVHLKTPILQSIQKKTQFAPTDRVS